MSDLKFSLLSAFVGFFTALFAFIFNYTFAPTSIPGYEVLAGPAMFALSFFSEETDFWPKLTIFLLGQYLFYFVVIYLFRKLIRVIHQ